MKISIITVSYNSARTIAETLRSVADQSFKNVEHIVIDGGSSDGTVEIIKAHTDHIDYFISESDQGMYDAMNKGLKSATGDILGFLHSDDVFSGRETIQDVADTFTANEVEAVYGDTVFVSPGNLDHVVRYYDSSGFNKEMIAKGCMPAHPTLFLKRDIYKKYGYFKTDYKIAADFEFVARVFGSGQISYRYIPKVMVIMRMGGVSTKSLRSNWILNQEMLRACRENGISTNYFKIYSKYPRKIIGLLNKKSKATMHMS